MILMTLFGVAFGSVDASPLPWEEEIDQDLRRSWAFAISMGEDIRSWANGPTRWNAHCLPYTALQW